jgi:transcriptional regulator
MAPLPLLRGTLDALVLKALASGPMHGYEITAWLDQRARGNLELLDSALYQAVYRLEARRLVAAEWGTTGHNRRARYYSLTPAGRAHLKREVGNWLRYFATVEGILTAPHSG